jgi:putative addiction module component (TIGR02574 family)
MSTTAEILESALTLPQKERAALALHLLESLEDEGEVSEEEETEEGLAVEVARRLDEVRAGKVTAIDGRTAIAAIRTELCR